MTEIQNYIRSLNPAEREALALWCRVEIARSANDPESFEAFYQLLWDRAIPPHAKAEWLRPIYQARAGNKGIIIEAFRGSSKTTTLTITYLMFQIGKSPEKSNLLIQNSDEAARDTTSQIADMIDLNLGWKAVFPPYRPRQTCQLGCRWL